MEDKQMYFRDTSSTFIEELDEILYDAEQDGEDEVTVYEAVLDTSGEYRWCTLEGEAVENFMCKKSECRGYSSKSGRGACEHRGTLYNFGEQKTFKVNGNS